MKQPSTILTTFKLEDEGVCKIRFTEKGWRVISSTLEAEEMRESFLHLTEESAAEITEACRDQIIRYRFCQWNKEKKGSPKVFPGLGESVEKKYLKGLSHDEQERIGNGGKKSGFWRTPQDIAKMFDKIKLEMENK